MARRNLMDFVGQPGAVALEQETPVAAQGPTIVMQGPLAEIYRKALDVAFAKTDTVTGDAVVGQQANISTETMANDVLMAEHMRRRSEAASDSSDTQEDMNSDSSAPVTTIYGVSDGDVNEQVVVDVTRHLASKKPEDSLYLVIDATQPSQLGPNTCAPKERLVYLSGALEAMVESHGGKTFKSFAAASVEVLKKQFRKAWPQRGKSKQARKLCRSLISRMRAKSK